MSEFFDAYRSVWRSAFTAKLLLDRTLARFALIVMHTLAIVLLIAFYAFFRFGSI